MKTAIAKIKFLTPYCQSRYHGTAKNSKELPDAYERRTWQERMHYDPETKEVFIPALAFSNSIKEAAKYISMSVPGKARSTYTKHFDAGVMVLDEVMTGRTIDQAVEKQMFVPSNGQRGGGTRVMKSYPILMPPLEVEVTYQIMDDLITAEVFAAHLQQAGNLIGVGSFRIRNSGVFGRFQVQGIDWIDLSNSVELPPINFKEAA